MSTNLEQVIFERVRALPVAQQEEVFKFVERLAAPADARRPLSEIAAELMKDVPPEATDQLPTDGAENHDHYLYGPPKK